MEKIVKRFDEGLSMKHLENCINGAIESGAKYIGVLVNFPTYKKPEVIINHIDNAEMKLEYYKFAYDDDLMLGNGIVITGFTYGNSFAEIEKDLLGLDEE